jgi:hypothetical protein
MIKHWMVKNLDQENWLIFNLKINIKMPSSFTIDFADLSGKGIEPIIRVHIGNGSVEDKLLRTLFQSTDNLKITYYTPDQAMKEEEPNRYLILSKQ